MGYLERAFGDVLGEAREAMALLAQAHEPPKLAAIAYHLYEDFRPEIPPGIRGWGVKGHLDLGRIREMAKHADPAGAS
jgi:hypothetical protein